MNKIGGRAWITLVNDRDRTYNVRYVLESTQDKNVPAQYVVVPKIEVFSFMSYPIMLHTLSCRTLSCSVHYSCI